MLRSHGTAQLLGLTLGAAGTVVTLLASLGCQPTETDDYRRQSLLRAVTDGESYHLTITLSRAAVEQATSGLQLSVSGSSSDGSSAIVTLVPDDAALDELVGGGSSLDVPELSTICPAVGDCVVGLTVVPEGPDVIDTSFYAHVRRPIADGRFTAEATLTLVED